MRRTEKTTKKATKTRRFLNSFIKNCHDFLVETRSPEEDEETSKPKKGLEDAELVHESEGDDDEDGRLADFLLLSRGTKGGDEAVSSSRTGGLLRAESDFVVA